jgi:nucleoside 2-deoxyribosyltransferase
MYKKTIYLAGPMEHDYNEGLNWRRSYEKALGEINIKCVVPNDEERDIKKNISMKSLKKNDIEKYISIMRQFIKQDLLFVDTVDMIVVRWEGQPTAGTIHEVGHAFEIGKPCYLVSSLPNEEILGWFLACFTKKFSSLKELIEFLREG